MSLASLTVDLTLGLAKFEGDSGKAAQIITRDSEKMSRAARTVEAALQKQADQAGRTQGEYLALQAAQAGLGESAQRLVAIIERSGSVSATAGGSAAAGFAAASAAADASVSKQRALNAELVQSILQVNAAYEARRTAIAAQGSSGAINTDQLKSQLGGLKAARDDAIAQLKTAAAQKQAENDLAATAAAAAEVRRTAAQKIIDAQNGLTASYRAQLAALRELRDAGSITPAQFKQAGTDLVAKQPATQQRAQEEAAAKAVADAEDEAANRRIAAFSKLRDAVSKSVYKSQVEQQEAAKATAAADEASVARRIAAFEKLRATVAELTFKQSRSGAAAESQTSAKAAVSTISESSTATAAAQSRVYAAFLVAQAAAVDQVAQAEAREAEISKSVAQASESARSAQLAQYQTKTAFIAAVNEEAAALFRTREAQRQLDAERAGVSSQQAAQLAKFAEDRQFTSGIYKQIDAQQQLADQFGKTAVQILREEAAQRGLTNTTASAIGRLEALAAANNAAAEAATRRKAADAFVASTNSLGAQINTDGTQKSRSELLALQAAELGVTEQTKAAIDKLALLDGRTGQLGKNVFATRNQLLTLKYTLSDVVASAASGISPLTILLQQGGQVAQIEGGVGGLFKTVTSLITPFRLAVGASAAAIAGLGYVFYEGSKQSKVFADSITLTGGYAGKTEGQFNQLAKNVAASGQVTIAAAREFGQALISTGQVGPQVLESATAAAAKYGEATGKSAKEVAADYAGMGQDVAKWAAEHNRQLNFISAAQYDQIKSLQDQGRAADAQAIVYDALNKRFTTLDQNLGTIEKTLKAVKGGWNSFWDAAFDVGRSETIEDKIKRAEDAAAALSRRLTDGRAGNPAFSSAPALRAQDDPANDPAERARVAGLAAGKSEEAVELKRLKIAQDSAVLRTAENAAITQRVIDGKALVKQYQDEAKGVTAYQSELKKLQSQFADAERIGNPYSPEAQAEALKGLKKKFTDSQGINESDAQRKALLAQDLKFSKDNLEQQKDLLQFNQQALAAIYAGGNVSLQAYYDERRQITARGVQNELDALVDEQARLEVELEKGAFKDPHQKIELQTQLNDTVAKSVKVQREAAQAATLSSLEEAAAFKALGDRVQDYRAQLLQLEGDEEGAARIRAAITEQNAKQFARQSGGQITENDVGRQTRAIAAANQLAEIQRKLSVATSEAARAEETFTLRSTQAGDNLIERDTGIYQLRAAALVQLGELADKARELADASTDPKIKTYAEDLALQYAKAADAVDPAITRLRSGADEMASSFRGTFDSIASGALTGNDAIKTLGKTVQTTLTKTFISEPLEAALKGGLRKLVDGDGIGAFLRLGTPSAQAGAGIDVAGAGYSPAKDSQTASEAFDALQSSLGSVVSSTVTQTTVTNTATSALTSMTAAAQAAAYALQLIASQSGGEADLFKQIAGASGSGSGVSDVGGVNAGYPAYGLANGTNYVPYDGFKATLHKGESVTPAKYNPAAGGRGSSSGGDQIQIVNNGAPVNVESSSTTTGADGRRLKKIVIGAFRDDIGTGGPMSQTMQSKFGVARRNPKRG